MRRQAYTARKWYITDGLVACWDGEYNAGTSMTHSNNASNWLDVINNLPLNGYNHAWDTNSAIFNGTSTYFTTTNTATKNAMNTGQSVEIVCRKNINAGWGVVFCANGNYIMGLNINTPRTVCLKGVYSGNDNHQSSYQWIDDGNIHSYSIYYSNWNMFLDGSQANYLGPQANGTSQGNYLLGKRIYQGVSGGFLDGNIYCIRIYNRQLSSSEIVYNYNVDEARFGL